MAVYTTVDKPTDYFETLLYTGNGSTNNITGLDFQPDWCWLKSRSAGYEHAWYDAPRGATKDLSCSTAEAEQTVATKLTAFNSDGFSLGNNAGTNNNTTTYAAWNWKANGQGSSNTSGSINTTYTSANTTSGVSVITYTGNGSSGATIGHGLGAVPEVAIVKLRSGGGYDWGVYHASLGATKNMRLNNTDAIATSTAFWNDTTPTSSLLSLGDNRTVNESGDTYVAYCFAPIQGFSSFNSFVGTGNVNGAFIYTGFKPAWVMIKCSSAANDEWFIWDNKRLGYNGGNNNFFADTSDVESTATASGFDLLSNGFKLRTTDTALNGSGRTYIYMAFAENPFVTSTGIPTTAR